MLDYARPRFAGGLCELKDEHFAAAELVADRRGLEVQIVCEISLAAEDRVLVMPWMLCERAPSGQFSLPRMTAPDIIAAASLDPSSLVELRKQMSWIRLIDLLCGPALPQRETCAVIEAFNRLHDLPTAPFSQLVAQRAQWLSGGGSLKALIAPAIHSLNWSFSSGASLPEATCV
ncbi:hypothetical protein [Chenggangzhangella methanolivorans]|uniref:Uncharacterized protein n=1 Tax=Chenggangzhangella methanolivorans TaxID=1437009 RepID=A0A9E6UPB9_9HYPH|nr:hypothetical protein [Chenggangzhangella methanolivorans]QZO02161.1 hypothetical protein K6K41_13435 [Chenggangzhangella methanolivorans]